MDRRQETACSTTSRPIHTPALIDSTHCCCVYQTPFFSQPTYSKQWGWADPSPLQELDLSSWKRSTPRHAPMRPSAISPLKGFLAKTQHPQEKPGRANLMMPPPPLLQSMTARPFVGLKSNPVSFQGCTL